MKAIVDRVKEQAMLVWVFNCIEDGYKVRHLQRRPPDFLDHLDGRAVGQRRGRPLDDEVEAPRSVARTVHGTARFPDRLQDQASRGLLRPLLIQVHDQRLPWSAGAGRFLELWMEREREQAYVLHRGRSLREVLRRHHQAGHQGAQEPRGDSAVPADP